MLLKIFLASIIFNLASAAWLYKKVAVKVGMPFGAQLFVILSSIVFNVVLSILMFKLWFYIIVGYLTQDMNKVWDQLAVEYERRWNSKKQ